MIEVEKLEEKIKTIIKYDMVQNAEQAYQMMQCLEIIMELRSDEVYDKMIDTIFTFDLKQNVNVALLKLKTIKLAIELEESL